MKDKRHIPFENATKKQDNSSISATDGRSCAVTAIATLFDVDYLVAYAVLANNGRKHGRGTALDTAMLTVSQLCDKLGYSYQRQILPIPMKSSLIAIANKDNKDARILMRTKGHIFAFINGKIHDTFIDDRKVYEIISITKNINYYIMATNIKDLTQQQRSDLITELSAKIMRKSFIKDEEREKAVKLLNMLSKHKASDEDAANEESAKQSNVSFDFEF